MGPRLRVCGGCGCVQWQWGLEGFLRQLSFGTGPLRRLPRELQRAALGCVCDTHVERHVSYCLKAMARRGSP